MTEQADPFGTARVVEQVLAGWAAVPERFREDANAEEDLALGGYRDRVVVELAQNAADAAVRQGVPGRLLLRLVDHEGDEGPAGAGVLVAANSGVPLDAAGVRALCTLRASAKRRTDAPDVVGRFGVGFAAVLAVTDTPAVCSRAGGVRFSRADTRALVEQAARTHPALGAELERREGHVPVLRLPFPAEGEPPQGYDTVVLLPLRDGAARDLVDRLLREVDDGLLLALPGLAEVHIELPGEPTLVLGSVGRRWRRVARDGSHDPADLADRPTEERQRPRWSLTWAVRRDGTMADDAADDAADGAADDAAVAGPARVVHAPTPTDEPLDWPALLVASFPLDPTRRHVAQGPATRALVRQAARAYVDLLVELAAEGVDVLPLVPVGLPSGLLDAQLREELAPLLPGAPLLLLVEGGDPVRPRDAVALEPGPWASDAALLQPLAAVVGGLVAAPREADQALNLLELRRLPLADLVEQLPAQPDAASWLRLYGALAPLAGDPAAREALSLLPVPLRAGRVVRGVRGAMVLPPTLGGDVADLLARLGVRVVDPGVTQDGAVVRLLERLGATVARPVDVLTSPEVRRAVAEAAASHEADDGGAGWSAEWTAEWSAEELADVVAALVAEALQAGDWPPAGVPWLRDVLLPDAEGDLAPAGWLVQPGSRARALLDEEEVGTLADDAFARFPPAVWAALGVAADLTAVTATDVDTADLPDDLADVAGAQEWADALGAGTVTEVVAVRDLDLVAPGAWPQALTAVAAEPVLRRALLDPVRFVDPDGRARHVPGLTGWWLRQELRLAGTAAPDGGRLLTALLPLAPRWVRELDADVGTALGLVRRWEDLDADGWRQVLTRSVSLDEPPAVPVLLGMWSALADRAEQVDVPDRLWALDTGVPTLVRTTGVVVPDAPMWLQRGDLGAAVVVRSGQAPVIADVLDLDLASERAPGRPDHAGDAADVPGQVREVLTAAPSGWREHDTLTVDGAEVDWWVEGSGPGATVHAATLGGLARGLAQSAGRWDLRWAVEAVLADPGDAPSVLVEQALG